MNSVKVNVKKTANKTALFCQSLSTVYNQQMLNYLIIFLLKTYSHREHLRCNVLDLLKKILETVLTLKLQL